MATGFTSLWIRTDPLPDVQQLNAAVLFAIGFMVRPIGGWLFGHLAGHDGQRNSPMSRRRASATRSDTDPMSDD